MNIVSLERLNQLSRVVQTAAGVASLARKTQTFSFNVQPPVTVYLHADDCEIRVLRHDPSIVTITAHLQIPFAWRLGAEQDDAGVYLAAHRKPVVGALAEAVFDVVIPHSAHIVVRTAQSRLILERANGVFEFPPDQVISPAPNKSLPERTV
jgi:hypothetical protein